MGKKQYEGSFANNSTLSDGEAIALARNSRLLNFCDVVFEDVGGTTELHVTRLYRAMSSEKVNEQMIVAGKNPLVDARRFAEKLAIDYQLSGWEVPRYAFPFPSLI